MTVLRSPALGCDARHGQGVRVFSAGLIDRLLRFQNARRHFLVVGLVEGIRNCRFTANLKVKLCRVLIHTA